MQVQNKNGVECFFEFPQEGYRIGVVLKTPKRSKRILEIALINNHTLEVFNASMESVGTLSTRDDLFWGITENDSEDEEIITNIDYSQGRSHVKDRIRFGDFELHDDLNGMAIMHNDQLLACIEEFIVFMVFQLFDNQEIIETSFLFSFEEHANLKKKS